MICSVLTETDGAVCESIEFEVESDKANYNVDLGFICRREGVLPFGVGEAETQNWTGGSGSDD